MGRAFHILRFPFIVILWRVKTIEVVELPMGMHVLGAPIPGLPVAFHAGFTFYGAPTLDARNKTLRRRISLRSAVCRAILSAGSTSSGVDLGLGLDIVAHCCESKEFGIAGVNLLPIAGPLHVGALDLRGVD